MAGHHSDRNLNLAGKALYIGKRIAHFLIYVQVPCIQKIATCYLLYTKLSRLFQDSDALAAHMFVHVLSDSALV